LADNKKKEMGGKSEIVGEEGKRRSFYVKPINTAGRTDGRTWNPSSIKHVYECVCASVSLIMAAPPNVFSLSLSVCVGIVILPVYVVLI